MVEVQKPMEAREAMREPTLEDLARGYVVDPLAEGIREGQTVGINHLFGPFGQLRENFANNLKSGLTPREALFTAVVQIENTAYGGVRSGALEALATLLVRKGEYREGQYEGHPILGLPEQDKINALLLAAEYHRLKTMKQILGVDRLRVGMSRDTADEPTLQARLDKVDRFQVDLRELAARRTFSAAP